MISVFPTRQETLADQREALRLRRQQFQNLIQIARREDDDDDLEWFKSQFTEADTLYTEACRACDLRD